MLLYYLFWMFMGFTLHFYIIFGTNLLTGGPARIAVFCLFQYFEEKEYQTESKRNEIFGSVILGTNVIQRTWSASQEAAKAATNLLLPPIYTHVPQKHPGAPRKTIPTTATFCIHEIPSWSLRRRSAGGGIDHGGLLHQHHSPSDEL